MTSKSKQLKKIPICIYFFKNQIPEELKKKTFEEFGSYSVLKKDDKIHLNLEKISKLNILQKNYKLL